MFGRHDDIQRGLRQLPEMPMRPEARQELLERMLEVHRAAREEMSLAGRPVKRLGNRVRRAALLTAAALLMAITVAGLWTFLSPRRAAASVTFAEVMQRMREVASARYTFTYYEGQRQIGRSDTRVADFGARLRYDSPAEGKAAIYDFELGKALLLSSPERATGVLMEVGNRREGERCNPVEALAGLPRTAGVPRGSERLDGRELLVFDIDDQRQSMRVWVDSLTNLPVKVRIVELAGAAAALQGSMVIDSIEWGCQFSPSLFELELPPGYLWEERRANEAAEQDLLETLRLWTELGDGRFPDSFTRSTLGKFVSQKAKEAGHQHSFSIGTWGYGCTNVVEPWEGLVKRARLGCGFALKVSQRGWHYQGRGVMLGDARLAICWWQADQADMYRVVFGDLTVRDLDTEDVSSLHLPPEGPRQ